MEEKKTKSVTPLYARGEKRKGERGPKLPRKGENDLPSSYERGGGEKGMAHVHREV